MTCPTCQTTQPEKDPEQQDRIFCYACDAPVLPMYDLFRCSCCGAINNQGRKCLTCQSISLHGVSEGLPF